MNSEEEARINPVEALQYSHALSRRAGVMQVNMGMEMDSVFVAEREKIIRSVSRLLMRAGVPAHLKGYHYLREAIVMTVIDFDNINAVTKRLYPVVARKFNTSNVCVERAIRHAIQIAWFREECASVANCAGVIAGTFSAKPTNSCFIAEFAEKIRHETFEESADD